MGYLACVQDARLTHGSDLWVKHIGKTYRIFPAYTLTYYLLVFLEMLLYQILLGDNKFTFLFV